MACDGRRKLAGAQHPQPSPCTTTQLLGMLVTEQFLLSTFPQEPIGPKPHPDILNQIMCTNHRAISLGCSAHCTTIHRSTNIAAFQKEISHTDLVQIPTSTLMFLIAGSHLRAGNPLPVIQCTKFPPCRLTSAPQLSLAAGLGRNETQRACSVFPTAFCTFLQHLIKFCTRFIVKGRWSNW